MDVNLFVRLLGIMPAPTVEVASRGLALVKCPECGYEMEPLDETCRRCEGFARIRQSGGIQHPPQADTRATGRMRREELDVDHRAIRSRGIFIAAIMISLVLGVGVTLLATRTSGGEPPVSEPSAVENNAEVLAAQVADPGKLVAVHGYIRTVSLEARCIELVNTELEAKSPATPRFHVLAFFTEREWPEALSALRSSREGWRCTVSDMSAIAHEYVTTVHGRPTGNTDTEWTLQDCRIAQVADDELSEGARRRVAAQAEPQALDPATTPTRDEVRAWITHRERRQLLDPHRAQVTPEGYGYVYVRGNVQNLSGSRCVRNVIVTWGEGGETAHVVPSVLGPRAIGTFQCRVVLKTEHQFRNFTIDRIRRCPEASGQWEAGTFGGRERSRF